MRHRASDDKQTLVTNPSIVRSSGTRDCLVSAHQVFSNDKRVCRGKHLRGWWLAHRQRLAMRVRPTSTRTLLTHVTQLSRVDSLEIASLGGPKCYICSRSIITKALALERNRVERCRKTLSRTFIAGCYRLAALTLVAGGLLAGCSTSPASRSSNYPSASVALPAASGTQSRIATASWYGPGFNGRRTASGEVFHQTDLTAASPTIPMGSHVRVTNLANGRSVVVRITDRGPFVSGRSIDLSHAAAERIGMARAGVGTVRISRLDGGGVGVEELSVPTHVAPSYAGFSSTMRSHEWTWHVKVTSYRPHHRYRRHGERGRLTSNPIGTWLLSALPRF